MFNYFNFIFMNHEYWSYVTSGPWPFFIFCVGCVSCVLTLIFALYVCYCLFNGDLPEFNFPDLESVKQKPAKWLQNIRMRLSRKKREAVQRRLEQEMRKKQQDDLRKQQEAEKQRQAAERKQQKAEQKRKEAERKQQKAEQKRQEAERKQQEAERLEAERKKQEAEKQRQKTEAMQKKTACEEYWCKALPEYGKLGEYNVLNDPNGTARKAIAMKILKLTNNEFTRTELVKQYRQLIKDYLPKNDRQISRKKEVLEKACHELINWAI